MEEAFYCNKPHPENTTIEGSLKRRPSLSLFFSLSLVLCPSHPLYSMNTGDVEKPNSELEVQEHALALNTTPDAEMASADQTANASTELEPRTQTDQMPVIGDANPVMQDQLDSITESVWQRIGQQLDAKCS